MTYELQMDIGIGALLAITDFTSAQEAKAEAQKVFNRPITWQPLPKAPEAIAGFIGDLQVAVVIARPTEDEAELIKSLIDQLFTSDPTLN